MADKALVVREDGAALPALYVEPKELARQRSAFNDYVNQNLREKVDYGLIPGVDKKTLLKPGAEKILQFYGCALELEETRYDSDSRTGYLFVEFRARAVTVRDRVVIGEGVGACSSFESKYRWRWEWWNGKGAPDGDEWERTRNGKYRKRVENRDLIDQWNTVIKMAKKRAHIDLALTISGASEMFTQDVEDFVDAEYTVVEPQAQEPRPAKETTPKQTKKSGKSERPFPPETTRNKIHITANQTFSEHDGVEASIDHIGFINGMLNKAGDGDESKRKLFLKYVFDVESGKELDKAQLMAIGRWLVDGDSKELIPDAIEEFQLIVREALKDAGQQDMFENQHAMPPEMGA